MRIDENFLNIKIYKIVFSTSKYYITLIRFYFYIDYIA